MARHRTAMGKSIDMAGLIARNDRTRAVGNKSVNARGDLIDQSGRVVEGVNDRVADSYQNTVGSSGATAGVSQSANPNAPLSPKQLRELASLKSGPIEEKPKQSSHPLLDEVAKNTPVVEVQSKTTEEATLRKFNEELHPDEVDFEDDEEDFDIEAIKAACLENTITTPEDK